MVNGSSAFVCSSPEKCEFEKTSVEYLVVVSHDSVKMDPAKVAGVSEWPTPSNKKEVQSFLGFTCQGNLQSKRR